MESQTPLPHLWNGIPLYRQPIEPASATLQLWTSTETNREAIHTIQAALESALPAIQALAPDLPIRAVVLPHDQFLHATDIPPTFANWATFCVREVFGDWRKYHMPDTEVCDAFVLSENYLRHAQKMAESSSEEGKDRVRGVLHEGFHFVQDQALGFSPYPPPPLNEVMTEAFPRFVVGLQAQMPESSAFLASLPPYDSERPKDAPQLLTAEQLKDGMAAWCGNPIATNHAYGSTALMGLGMLHRFTELHGDTDRQATERWFEVLRASHSPEALRAHLCTALQMPETEVFDTLSLQLRGQEELKRRYLSPEAVVSAAGSLQSMVNGDAVAKG